MPLLLSFKQQMGLLSTILWLMTKNEDSHTLACFLGLMYHEYIHLLEVCCLAGHIYLGKQQECKVCVSVSKLKQFIQMIPNTDFSHTYSLFYSNTYTQYHVMHLGGTPNTSFSALTWSRKQTPHPPFLQEFTSLWPLWSTGQPALTANLTLSLRTH